MLSPDDIKPAEDTKRYKTCSGCKGTGIQALFTSTHTCDVCGGKGVETVELEPPPQGWTLINSLALAERYKGRTVDVFAPECTGYTQHHMHLERVGVTDVDSGNLYLSNPASAAGYAFLSWRNRGNVMLHDRGPA